MVEQSAWRWERPWQDRQTASSKQQALELQCQRQSKVEVEACPPSKPGLSKPSTDVRRCTPLPVSPPQVVCPSQGLHWTPPPPVSCSSNSDYACWCDSPNLTPTVCELDTRQNCHDQHCPQTQQRPCITRPRLSKLQSPSTRADPRPHSSLTGNASSNCKRTGPSQPATVKPSAHPQNSPPYPTHLSIRPQVQPAALATSVFLPLSTGVHAQGPRTASFSMPAFLTLHSLRLHLRPSMARWSFISPHPDLL